MNKRAFLSRAVLATALVALGISTAAAQSAPQQLKPGVHKPKAPIGFATKPGGPPQRAGYEHDSDAQLDIWVQRCNDAGGGMITGEDGNYDCIDSSGNSIPDW